MGNESFLSKMKSGFQPSSPFEFGQGASEVSREKVLQTAERAQPIELPRHLFPPANAETIDISNVATLAIGELNTQLIRFTPKRGELAIFTHYTISNDALLATDADFFPLVNGKRIMPYHGDPLDDFRIYLSVAPDLSVLKQGIVIVAPGDVYEWRASNYAAVAITVGVRAVGYISRHELIEARRFG